MDDSDQHSEPWQISCSADRFEAWRNDPGFRAVVTLARVANALRFAGYALVPVRQSDTPAAIRQRMNSFMYAGALVFEALALIKKVDKDLAKYDAYEGLRDLVATAEDKQLVDKRLKKLRNRAVFHFDHTFVPKTLGAQENGRYVFARGANFKEGELYYDIADVSAMNTVIGTSDSREEYLVNAGDLIRRTTALMLRLLKAVDGLVLEVLQHPDWEKHRL